MSAPARGAQAAAPRFLTTPQSSPQIHPSAVVGKDAEFAADVSIEPFVVIEGRVQVARGCRIGVMSRLEGPLSMGPRCRVFNGVALGGPPQHVKYGVEPTGLTIGADNVFRERTTVHRACVPFAETRIGDGNVFQVGSHVAHDCQVGDGCSLGVNALLSGHAIINDGAVIGDYAAVHQFCRVGRLAVLLGGSFATQDVPPFVVAGVHNSVAGINVQGMRLAGFDGARIDAVRRVFDFVFCQGLALTNALSALDGEFGDLEEFQEFAAFVRQSTRGIVHWRGSGSMR